MEKEEGGGTELEQDTRSKPSLLFCFSQLHISLYAVFIGQFNFCASLLVGPCLEVI